MEKGIKITKKRALSLVANSNSYLAQVLKEKKKCNCGCCYLCAYNYLKNAYQKGYKKGLNIGYAQAQEDMHNGIKADDDNERGILK